MERHFGVHRRAPASCGGCGDRAVLLCPGGGCGTLWLCWMEMRCLSFPRLGSGCTETLMLEHRAELQEFFVPHSILKYLNTQGCFSLVAQRKEQNWQL